MAVHRLSDEIVHLYLIAGGHDGRARRSEFHLAHHAATP